MTDRGDCFATACGLAVADDMLTFAGQRPLVLNEKSPWRIVHGLPVGTSGDVAGVRYWHAWVELTTEKAPVDVLDGDTPGKPRLDGHPVLVFDYANEHRYQVVREDYYRVGQITEAHVWRYTPGEARKLLRKLGHVGPWPDGWETIGDGDGRLRRTS